MATTRPSRGRRAASSAGPTRTPRPPRSAEALEPPAPKKPSGAIEPAIPPEHQAILHHALVEAARLLRADGAIAYLLDATTGVLRFADDAGISDERRQRWIRNLRVEPGVGLFGMAVSERRIVLSDDYPNDPGFLHFEGADRLVDDVIDAEVVDEAGRVCGAVDRLAVLRALAE